MFPVRRILVIDDDEVMRDLLHALLPMDGYEVCSANDGEEALHLVTECAADLVLMDLHLPGLEGKQLVDALRSAAPQGTLLVGMSGSNPDPELAGILDAFLLKPFDTDALQLAIHEAQGSPLADTNGANSSMDTGSLGVTGESEPAIAALDVSIFDSLLQVIPQHQLAELYELMLNDIAKRLDRIQLAADGDNLSAAQREAHAIKGSCGMVGAVELQSLAAAIEDGSTINTSAIAQIPSACLRLRRMLDAKLQPVSLLGEPRS